MVKRTVWRKCIWKRLLPILCALLLLPLSGWLPVNAAENMENGTAEGAAVMIRVEGEIENADRQALLDRINEIRKEACEEGVRNPADGVVMTPKDYVPLQWSLELEDIAVLRAAESTILQDHVRPDGRECFTAAPEGISYTMETLAWGFGSAAGALEGWYSEKVSYVEETGEPAGHYMALINPQNRFVAVADLRALWQRDACAGAFAPSGDACDPASVQKEYGTEWIIPLQSAYMEHVIGRAVEITAVRIFNAAALR